MRLYVLVHCQKELKCSGDSEIQHEIHVVRDTSRKSEKHELIREVSQTIFRVVSRNHLLSNSRYRLRSGSVEENSDPDPATR